MLDTAKKVNFNLIGGSKNLLQLRDGQDGRDEADQFNKGVFLPCMKAVILEKV